MEDFQPRRWRCNRCGKWNRIKKVFRSGEYLKTCKCGRTMKVLVEMEWTKIANPKIIGLYDIHRRCNRGEVKPQSLKGEHNCDRQHYNQ